MLSFAWKRPRAFRMRSRMRSATGVRPSTAPLPGSGCRRPHPSLTRHRALSQAKKPITPSAWLSQPPRHNEAPPPLSFRGSRRRPRNPVAATLCGASSGRGSGREGRSSHPPRSPAPLGMTECLQRTTPFRHRAGAACTATWIPPPSTPPGPPRTGRFRESPQAPARFATPARNTDYPGTSRERRRHCGDRPHVPIAACGLCAFEEVAVKRRPRVDPARPGDDRSRRFAQPSDRPPWDRPGRANWTGEPVRLAADRRGPFPRALGPDHPLHQDAGLCLPGRPHLRHHLQGDRQERRQRNPALPGRHRHRPRRARTVDVLLEVVGDDDEVLTEASETNIKTREGTRLRRTLKMPVTKNLLEQVPPPKLRVTLRAQPR